MSPVRIVNFAEIADLAWSGCRFRWVTLIFNQRAACGVLQPVSKCRNIERKQC